MLSLRKRSQRRTAEGVLRRRRQRIRRKLTKQLKRSAKERIK
jgi:hypothetical protein